MAEWSLGVAELGTQVSLDGLHKGIDQAEAAAKGGFERIGGILKGALTVGLTAAAGGFLALSSAIGAGVADAREATALLAQTQAVIKSTGGVAGVSAQQVTDLATALSAASGMSLFGDAEIQDAENMLLTFTNIGQDVFPAATQATIDMAAAFHTTPAAFDQMIGKALNSAEGFTALKRSGVAFTDSQEAQIKTLFASGHAADAQRIILAELNKEFGGSAEAAARADGGWAQFTDRMGEAAELAGNALLPVLSDVFSFLNSSVAPVIERAAQTFANLVDAFRVGAEESGGFIGGLTNALYVLDDISPIFDTIADVILALSQVFSDAASQASSWGEGIIDQLAVGMSRAFSSVIGVLRQLGSVIASWLQPHSPPKILPDIDDWGRETAELWLQGFTAADASAVSGLGDSVRAILEGMDGPKTGIIPAVIGTEQAMTEAIASVDQFGNVSEDAIRKVIDASGLASPQIEGLVRGYFDLQQAAGEVERAQAALNRVTEDYANQLTPLNAELAKIQDQKRAIQDQIRVKKLQEEIADSKTDELTRQQDLLEIQEIQKRQQIDSIEQQRDAAVDATKKELDAAKAKQAEVEGALAAQKAQISYFTDQKKLLKEQRDLLRQMAKEQSDARAQALAAQERQQQADAAAHAKAIQNAVADATTQEDKLKILREAQAQTEQGSDAWRAYQQQIDSITKQQEDSAKRRDEAEWNYRYSIADEAGKLVMLQEKLGGLTTDQEDYWRVLTQIDQVQDSIARKAEAAAKAKGAGGAPIPEIGAGGLPPPALPDVAAPLAGINAQLDEGQARVAQYRDSIVGAFQTIGTVDWSQFAQNAGQWALDALPVVLTNLAAYREQLLAWITESLPGWLDNLRVFAQGLGQWVLDAIPGVLANLGTFFKAMIDQTITYVPQWIAELAKFALEMTAWVIAALPDLLTNLGVFLTDMNNWVLESLPKWGAELAKLTGELAQWILDALPGMGTNLGKAAGIIFEWVITTAADVIPKLFVLAGKFFSWIATDVIPKLPGALLTIATALYNFISEVVIAVGPKLLEVANKFLDWVANDVLPALPDKLKEIQTAIGVWIGEQVIWIAKEVVKVGTAIVAAIKQGIQDEWGRLVNWFNDKLQELRDKLPFSEPKDTSSPLYGLADSGAAMVEMIQSGIDGFGDGLPSIFASSLAPVGSTLPALAAMPGLPASAMVNNTNYNIDVDARGSNWTEEQFKQMVRSVLNETGQDALSRARGRG